MNAFDALVQKVDSFSHIPRIVAISGFGGAGKSHLADRLSRHYGISERQIIRIDELYSKNPLGTGILDQVDWDMLVSILDSVRNGSKRLKYRGRSYRGESLDFDEEVPAVLIVEGIRLLQPRFKAFFDLGVWINCSQEIAIERAKSRDLEQGESEEEVSMWDTHWGPLDKQYFEKYQPMQLADILFEDWEQGSIRALEDSCKEKSQKRKRNE